LNKTYIDLVCFVFLHLVYHLLPVSLPDCIFLIAPSVLSNVYLHPWRVLYEQNGMKLCFCVHFFFPSNFMFMICFALLPYRPVNGRRVWRYQRGNQNPYIEEKQQTTQWPKEKVEKDKQWFTKHTRKTKDRVTWTALRIEGELGCSGRVSSNDFCLCFILYNTIILVLKWYFYHLFRRRQWYYLLLLLWPGVAKGTFSILPMEGTR
jgi:hypothetical protein